MLNLSKVAVTGGLASGKTTVCNFFKELNAYVVNADELVHQLLSQDASIGQQVVSLLGEEIVKEGELDRKQIAEKVFSDPLLLKKLEECLYPSLFEQIKRHYQEAKQLNSPLFVVEIPKLFESGMNHWFDAIITVSTDEPISLERFGKKGGTKNEYIRRMAAQMPLVEKIKLSTYVIENNGDLDTLKSSVIKLFRVLTRTGVAP